MLGGYAGESSSNNLGGENKFLFATNTGSNGLTVFRIHGDQLDPVDLEPTGNDPLSVTVDKGSSMG